MQKRLSRIDYQKQHRQDVIWQIWLPIGLGSLALLSLGVLAGLTLQSGSDSSARWAQISTMWLILPVFITGLMVLVILIGLIVGVAKLTQILPVYSEIAQVYTNRAAEFLQNLILRTAQPVIQIRALKAMLDQFGYTVRSAVSGEKQNNLSIKDDNL